MTMTEPVFPIYIFQPNKLKCLCIEVKLGNQQHDGCLLLVRKIVEIIGMAEKLFKFNDVYRHNQLFHERADI